MNRSILVLAGAVALAGAGNEAQASCGSAFCIVNTSWNVQGAWTEPGARFDLRFEYIDQDQPRAGSDKVAVGQIPQHHDEVRTINRNWLATFDYTFNADWGVSATLPLVDRFHEHIHNLQGQKLVEQWNAAAARQRDRAPFLRQHRGGASRPTAARRGDPRLQSRFRRPVDLRRLRVVDTVHVEAEEAAEVRAGSQPRVDVGRGIVGGRVLEAREAVQQLDEQHGGEARRRHSGFRAA